MKSGWQKYLLYASVVIVGGGLVLALVRLILFGYMFPWTGFGEYISPNPDIVREKTLWDWMDLLIIPFVLALGAILINRSERALERKTAEDRAILERELATDRQQEAALQAYLDRMGELLLEKKLRTAENEEVRNVARTRTLTVLRGLDAVRKGLVLKFLYEAELISKENPIINLHGANLMGADLMGDDLHGANLSFANLSGAILIGANLSGANMGIANLIRADLERAFLVGADLHVANMMLADLTGADLGGADLRGATLRSANLRNADLVGAHLGGADFRDVNLRNAILEDANLGDANLKGATVTDEQLAQVNSLKGAIMPDGTKHE